MCGRLDSYKVVAARIIRVVVVLVRFSFLYQFIFYKNLEEIYLNFDDTMIAHGKINLNLMRYLYQCVNNNIPIKLLTKHDYDIYATLRHYKILPELFDEIIHIDRTQCKCDFVRPGKNTLFIDDPFAERLQMQRAHGIVALGVDAVETLLDYRQ